MAEQKMYDLHGIFRPGIHEDCRDPAMEHYLQPQAQQTEQTAVSG